jgi:NitT/TauT family transport system substrate-binding protein
MSNLKPWVKIALIMLLVFGLGTALYKLSGGKDESGKTANTSEKSGIFSGIFGSNDSKSSSDSDDKDYQTVGVNTYAGFTTLVGLNHGLEPNEDCPLFKEFGIKLKIVIQDDFEAGRAAFKSGDIDFIYCTTDVLSTEMGNGSDMVGCKQFMILNKSRGSDAIVVSKNIKTVKDLKGKTIAYAPGTASHTLLINVLETNGLTMSDIKTIKVGSGIDAAIDFKAGKVDAAVVWAPDDADCVENVKGSKVLVSTKQASEIITDGLIAKTEYIDSHKEYLTKFIQAILYGNSLLNTNPSFVKESAKYFAKAFGTDESFCIQGCKNIRFATLGDEANFFGLNASYTGTQAEYIYSKMARVYEEVGLTKSPAPWRKVSDISIIETLWDSKDVKGEQSAESSTVFNAPTKEIITQQEISNRQVTINFESGSDVLDSDARSIIDREFLPIAKGFNNVRIRVEGNCDWTGNAEFNKKLSKRRAKSVVRYLVDEYGYDEKRFIIIGNGSTNAINDGVKGDNASYRTTDFQLLSE